MILLCLAAMKSAQVFAGICAEEATDKIKRVQGYFVQDHKPVKPVGVKVELYRVAYASRRLEATVDIGASGIFDFGRIEPGEYKVQIPGYMDSETFVVTSASDKKSNKYLMVELLPYQPGQCSGLVEIRKHSDEDLTELFP